MGEVKLNFAEWSEQFLDSLDTRLDAFADLVADDARTRAPKRREPRLGKKTAGRKRGTNRTFIPDREGQSFKFGKVRLSGSDRGDYYSIHAAASRRGIPLFLSASLRRQAGRGELLVRERRPERRLSRLSNEYLFAVLKGKVANRDRAKAEQQQRKAADTFAAYDDKAPGRLRRSIAAENTSDYRHIKYTVRADVPYAKYVEFPTSRTAAQPFLLPALKNARSRLAPWMKGRER